MSAEVLTKWTGDMSFESLVDGHKIIMDASDSVGGKNKGPRPKPLLLSAIAGCSGMDIASLLKKMRAEVKGFEMQVTAETSTEHPKYFTKIHIRYIILDPTPQKDKIEKAVTLSQERYCAVSYMLGKASKLTYEIEYRTK